MNCKFKFSKTNELVDTNVLLNSIDESIAGIIPTTTTSNEKLISLIESISNLGQIEPVLVYKGKLVDGRHRCLACRSLDNRLVKTNYIDDNVAKKDVEDYITSIELVNKDLSTWQKALIAYERYMEGRGESAKKTSIIANIRIHNLTAIKTVLEHKFGKANGYREAIRNGRALKLPTIQGEQYPKFTKSVITARNALLEYDAILKQQGKDKDDERNFKVVYERALVKWDIDDKIGDLFWLKKKELSIGNIEQSVSLLHGLLLAAYDEYKDELTVDMIKKEITLNDKE